MRIPCPVARADPTRAAVVVGTAAGDDVVTDYGALHRRASRMVRALRDQGLAGRRLAVRARASVDVVALHVAAARTSTTLIPLNLRLLPAEQQRLAAQAHAAQLLDDDDVAALAAGNSDDSDDDHTIDPAHETVLFTSGTTGRPKGARVPFRALLASSAAAGPVVDAGPDDVWLLCLPLFHVGGIAMMWRSLLGAATLRLVPPAGAGQAGLDLDAIAALIARGGFTQASLVPTSLQALLPRLTDIHPQLKAVLIGGGPVPEHLLVDAAARGLPVRWTWGMTETTSQAATSRATDPIGSCAAALPGLTLRVVDDDGVPVARGVVGNVEVRGATLFAGYLDDDDATAAALTRDGFLRTGDLGALEVAGPQEGGDGHERLAIASRRVDLIVSGGENLYPAQIEDVLGRCPAVVDVVICPVADDRWGQRPQALAVLRSGVGVDVDVDADVVRAWARDHLPRIQQPDRVVVVDALPRNALGKLDRRAAALLLDGLLLGGLLLDGPLRG